MALTINRRFFGSLPVLELVGRVSDDDARELSQQLRGLCKKGYERVMVDVSRVQFMDSHGLGVFVYYSSLMEKGDRRLVFVNSNRNPTCYMNRLFEMTNLNKVLCVTQSMDAL